MKHFLSVSLLFWAVLSFAQHNRIEDHVMRIRKTAEPVHVDGLHDEAVWQSAEMMTGFHRAFPVDTGFSETQTEVRLTFDDKYLYMAAVCYQKRGSYTVQSLKRDFPGGTSDVINLVLDPTKDGLNGFIFGVSPLGVQREALAANGDNMAFEWDNKWFSAVKNYEDRWTVEMAVPFKTLRYNVSQGQNTWRVNFIRTRLNPWEVSVWSPVPVQYRPNNVAFCGLLEWQDAPPRPSLNVSLIPYASGGYSVDYVRDDDYRLLDKPSTFTRDIGGDAKIAITSGLNLDLTVNPDFSQVEVDQQVANLSRFELFFPERRQFFLENRDLFAMFGFPSTRPFFSRRIGLAYDSIADINQSVPILAGARLSGKLTDDWRVGLLNMQTKSRRWGPESVLPGANFTVATAQRKVFGRSALSAILVNKQNFLKDLSEAERGGWQNWNRVAGLEFNYYSKDNRWEGEWYYHRSFSPDKTREDHSFAHFLGYNVRNWNGRLGYWYIGENYDSDAAEAGFVPRGGVQGLFPGFSWVFWPNSSKINNISLGVEGDLTFDLTGKSTDRDLGLNLKIDMKDQSSISAGVYHNYIWLFDPFDPTNLYQEDDDTLPANRGYTAHGFSGEIFTSTSYDWQANLQLAAGGFFNGNWVSAEGFVSYRMQPIGLFSIAYSYNRIRLPQPYASANVLLVGPKAELSFSKNFFASAFLQYNNQLNNFNINARLQWRFAPVSDMFLVYTDNSFAERIDNTPVRFFTPKNRALIFKIVYWLNV